MVVIKHRMSTVVNVSGLEVKKVIPKALGLEHALIIVTSVLTKNINEKCMFLMLNTLNDLFSLNDGVYW